MGVSALFPGDASTSVEQNILLDDRLGFFEEKKVDLKSTEILKVSHHGSADSSSLSFLQYLNVRTAVVSCGKDNEYGHPHETVIDSLKSVGAEIYRTDEKGHVTVTVKRDGTYVANTIKS
jgi:competence protein ComEC